MVMYGQIELREILNTLKNLKSKKYEYWISELQFQNPPEPYEINVVKVLMDELENKMNISEISSRLFKKSVIYRVKHKSNSSHIEDDYSIDDLVSDIRELIGVKRLEKFTRLYHEFYDLLANKQDKERELTEEDYGKRHEKIFKVLLLISDYYGDKLTVDTMERFIYSLHIYDNNRKDTNVDFLYDVLDVFLTVGIDNAFTE
jgi:hypothetical protein